MREQANVAPMPPGPGLPLRVAAAADAAFLLALRNDAVVRAASRNQAEVAPEEHRAWLARSLEDPDRHLLIVPGDGGAPAGQLRLDRLSGGEWEISVALSPGARGSGRAAPAIAAAVAWLRARESRVVVVAAVRPENARSAAAFARAGFVPDGDFADGTRRLVSRP